MDEGSGALDALTGVGQEIVATKYLSIACATILFYEYFLTFSDEVQYAWQGRKTWVFFLFCMNRYLPIAYKIWDLSYDGQYLSTQLVTWAPEEITSYCSVTTFAENTYLLLVTLLSQLFLVMRVYAVKRRDKASVAVLSPMVIIQFAYGVVYVAVFRREAFTYVSLAHPEEYTFAMCLQNPNGTSLQLGYLALSLGFDLIAFLMIAVFSYQSAQTFGNSSLFGQVVQDTTVYFLVIVWVHLTVIIYVSKMGASRILMLFPSITNTITPVMICRLVLSLRKATDPNAIKAWNVDHFSTQVETRTQSLDGALLSPIRFRSYRAAPVSSPERGAESENGLMIPSVDRSPFGSRWTIEGLPEGEENSR